MNLINHAVEIRRHHDAARAAAVTAIEHALAAGKILAQVKEELPHGEFGNWVTSRRNPFTKGGHWCGLW